MHGVNGGGWVHRTGMAAYFIGIRIGLRITVAARRFAVLRDM